MRKVYHAKHAEDDSQAQAEKRIERSVDEANEELPVEHFDGVAENGRHRSEPQGRVDGRLPRREFSHRELIDDLAAFEQIEVVGE
jgi:hypothetical protein